MDGLNDGWYWHFVDVVWLFFAFLYQFAVGEELKNGIKQYTNIPQIHHTKID